jgi:hypothetical protein
MPSRRMFAPLVVTAAVAGGGIAGAAIGVPGTSDAQESPDPDPEPEPELDVAPERSGPFAAAAEALGMETRELLEALRDDTTIAEIAQERDVDVDTVIDAMVAAVLERSERTEAEVREWITQLVNEGGEGRRPLFRRHHSLPGLDTAAEALGMEPSELAEAMRDGRTIAEIAEERGVDVNAVIEALVADARERITDFVNEGPRRLRDAGPDDERDSDSS